MDIGGWLRCLGLEPYEATFRENEIDESVLQSLTAEDLKELGVGALGHRRKLLDAIAALRAGAIGDAPSLVLATMSPSTPAVTETTASQASGERRYLTVMFCDLGFDRHCRNSMPTVSHGRIVAQQLYQLSTKATFTLALAASPYRHRNHPGRPRVGHLHGSPSARGDEMVSARCTPSA